MNKRLNKFIYSQNSINTYKSCPIKFKYKYIDKINWKFDDIGSREYYEGLKLGREFHLICERYFSNIPLGIDDKNKDKFGGYIDKIKALIPINEESIYLPEYEIRYKLNEDIIIAKYDLIIINQDNIEIWDWKTENKKINYKNVESRMQTIVYMLLAKEVIPKIYNLNINAENFKMKYYQPEFDDKPITINYTEDKHNVNKEKIKEYIEMIKETKYSEEDKEFRFELIKNNKHCKFCEFNKLCNNQEVNYDILEEGVYEC